MGLLYGSAGCLTAKNGGLRPGQFAGQDHYDCVRFAGGAFGVTTEQLDCP
jgi:hypothetical protein